MATARREDFKVARVLHEDDDFVTLEVGKNDSVVFNLQQNDEGEVVGGDKFLTLLFVHQVENKMEVWNPFNG